MPKYLSPFLAAIALFLFGCHAPHSVHVTPGTNINVRFLGFSEDELDTVYITGFEPGSAFSKIMVPRRADTSLAPGTTSTITDFIEYTLPGNTEWKIYIPALNKTYSLSNYGYRNIMPQNYSSANVSQMAQSDVCDTR